MTPTDPQPHTRQRFTFNARLRNPVTANRRWPVRSEKFISGAWVTVARWAPLRDPEEIALQRERMGASADAFGGLVRLMRGELLLAAWQDGVLEVDLRDEGEVGKAAE